ncbi:Protein of unknown function [Ferrimonas sediminum]|uniref:DUF3135 domain-containing protein n=1 Tax=Ferrimonas sediminum TaxID=718193 RepID=A0A1G9ALE5_9GAMM|nr:DUF3135 domain-containing protein [Ferrimonas sediminum]SDK27644.1 Protein of unknown function [Ferrimonas sediminum]
MITLPSFDEMMRMAKEEPQALEALRTNAIEQTIANAKADNQPQLRALQHRIDVTITRASNPCQSMVQLSNMMHDKLALLNTAFQNPAALDQHQASVAQFRPNPQRNPAANH